MVELEVELRPARPPQLACRAAAGKLVDRPRQPLPPAVDMCRGLAIGDRLDGERQLERQGGAIRDALLGADEVVEAEREPRRALGVGDQPRGEGIDHLVLVAESDEPAGQLEAARCGIEQLDLGERTLGELDRGRITGIARVLPVDVPARREAELQAETGVAAGRRRAPARDQSHRALLGLGPRSGDGPGGRRESGERDEQQPGTAHRSPFHTSRRLPRFTRAAPWISR
jgi:hypothetical protein